MNRITKTGCIFYVAATAAIAVQQLCYGDFCPIFFPAWPNPFSGYGLLAYVFSCLLLVACYFILTGKYTYTTALLLGSLLIMMLIFGQIPWEYIVFPHKKTHLGVWALPLKELAWAGGAFCIAGAAKKTDKSFKMDFLEKLIPFGPVFFATTMILFGVCHLLYTPGIAAMVPAWLPAHYFWTYFSAAALILSGVSIITKVWIRNSSLLLAIMIFFWFVFLHVPHALAYPLADKGNLVFSALSALAFSGIALIISGENRKKPAVKK